MNILPFPGTHTTRTLPFLITPKKPASTAALEAALASAGNPPSEHQAPTPPLTPSPTPLPPTRKDGQAALTWLIENNFIGKPQAATVKHLIRTSEEWEFFAAKMVELKDRIEAMPHTYQQDGKGDDAIAYLHYFGGSYDAYITEKDMGAPDDTPAERQWQAFGFQPLFRQDPELGYICLPEILASGRIELDFHFTPKTLREIKGIPDEPEASEVQTPQPTPADTPAPSPTTEIPAPTKPRPIAKIKHGYLKLWNGTPEAWTDYA